MRAGRYRGPEYVIFLDFRKGGAGMADQAIQWVKKQINAFEQALHEPERRPALIHKCNRAVLVLAVLAILLGAPLRYAIAPVLIVLLIALFLLGRRA